MTDRLKEIEDRWLTEAPRPPFETFVGPVCRSMEGCGCCDKCRWYRAHPVPVHDRSAEQAKVDVGVLVARVRELERYFELGEKAKGTLRKAGIGHTGRDVALTALDAVEEVDRLRKWQAKAAKYYRDEESCYCDDLCPADRERGCFVCQLLAEVPK